jgi:hypothetical protein
MSSSIEKNRRSVALTGAERIRRHREKQRKNQQPDHDASIAETQQPRPIPLTATERKRLERALKRRNQPNDAEAQNRPVPSSNAERTRRHREAKRKNRPDDAEVEKEKDRQSKRKRREIESEDARKERVQKQREQRQQRRQKQASILQDLPISSQTPQHTACATNARQQQSQVVTAHKENHIHGDDGNNSDSSEDWNEAEKENTPLRVHHSQIQTAESPSNRIEYSNDNDTDNQNHPPMEHRDQTTSSLGQQPNSVALVDLKQYSLNVIMDDMDKDEMDFEEEIQKFALRNHPRIHQLSKEYLSKLDESMDSMYRCPGCKVRYFERKPRDSEGDCKLCRSSIKKHGIRITSAENDMDPFPYGYPDDFPMLTPIETMLISPAYPFMKVYTFANGATGFRGFETKSS